MGRRCLPNFFAYFFWRDGKHFFKKKEKNLKKKSKKSKNRELRLCPAPFQKKADAAAVLQREVAHPRGTRAPPPARPEHPTRGAMGGTSSWKRFWVRAGRLLEAV